MSIPGYRHHDPTLPAATITPESFAWMKEAVLLGDDDLAALRRSAPILAGQTDAILDVWYGFVGSKSFLLAEFSDPATGAPQGDYLAAVRARFGQWIHDTAAANYDEAWLKWQLEIGKRHHRVGKNRTDGATASPIVRYRFLPLLAQPIVDTLRTFLEAGGDDRDTVDAMQNAWRKSVLLQVTLWSKPYVIEGDY
ncbi:MAG: protoglobin domain-containing protein [Myxococcota bacterium]